MMSISKRFSQFSITCLHTLHCNSNRPTRAYRNVYGQRIFQPLKTCEIVKNSKIKGGKREFTLQYISTVSPLALTRVQVISTRQSPTACYILLPLSASVFLVVFQRLFASILPIFLSICFCSSGRVAFPSPYLPYYSRHLCFIPHPLYSLPARPRYTKQYPLHCLQFL